MEERERRRSPRTRGSGSIPGTGDRRTRARDSSDPLCRERGRSWGRGPRDYVPREGGGRPRPRDSSAPLIREGSRNPGGGRLRARDSSAPSPREGARAPSEPPCRVRIRNPISPLKRKEGRAPGRGSARGHIGLRGHSELGGRAPAAGRSGGPPPAALPGEEAPGVGIAGGAPPSRAGRQGPRGEGRGRAMAAGPSGLLSCEVSQAPGLGYKGSPPALSPEGGESPPGPQLDVSSEQFDPLLALYSPKLPLPFPQVRAFNNLAEYESFQRRGGGPKPRGAAAPKNSKSKKPLPDPERLERLKNLVVVEGEPKPRPPRRGHKGPKNVLTRMSLNEGSPLGELHRCVRDRVKVNIHIRTFKGMRGVCSGFLVAFDKFWNMALTDVDETYRKPVLGKAFSHEPQLTLTRLFDRLKLQESFKTASETSTEGRHTKSSASKEEPRYGTTSSRYDTARRSNKSQTVQKEDEESHSPPEYQTSKTLRSKQSESRSSTGVKAQTLTRPHRPKVDYQQVHTRHINQMFIRGENILLIHLAQ